MTDTSSRRQSVFPPTLPAVTLSPCNGERAGRGVPSDSYRVPLRSGMRRLQTQGVSTLWTLSSPQPCGPLRPRHRRAVLRSRSGSVEPDTTGGAGAFQTPAPIRAAFAKAGGAVANDSDTCLSLRCLPPSRYSRRRQQPSCLRLPTRCQKLWHKQPFQCISLANSGVWSILQTARAPQSVCW